MPSLDRRLTELERHNPGTLGLRIFQQQLDDPECFREMNIKDERYFTQAQIDALSEEGWQVWQVVYGPWRGEADDWD
jgi:hypothetical protein